MMIAALLVIALAQPGRTRAANPPPEPPSDWKIEMTTDGGFTGGGNGGLVVSSDGALVITFGSTSASKKCGFHLTAGEMQALNEAIKNARPKTWAECHSLADVSTHCCDLIRTTFSLSARNGRDLYITSWLTGSPPLPNDLQSIVELLRGPAGLDARYRPLCATTTP